MVPPGSSNPNSQNVNRNNFQISTRQNLKTSTIGNLKTPTPEALTHDCINSGLVTCDAKYDHVRHLALKPAG